MRGRIKNTRVKKNESYPRIKCPQNRIVAFHGAPIMAPIERTDSMQWRKLGVGDQRYSVRKGHSDECKRDLRTVWGSVISSSQCPMGMGGKNTTIMKGESTLAATFDTRSGPKGWTPLPSHRLRGSPSPTLFKHRGGWEGASWAQCGPLESSATILHCVWTRFVKGGFQRDAPH